VETGGIVPGGSLPDSGCGDDVPANAAGSIESSESNDKFVLEDLLAECLLAHVTTLVPDGVAVRILHERAGFTWSRSQLSLSAMCAKMASLYWCDPWLAAVLSVGTGKNGKSGGTSCLQGGVEGPLALLLLPRRPYPRHDGTSALTTSTICDALPLSGKLWH
jgi:hypothetical protein